MPEPDGSRSTHFSETTFQWLEKARFNRSLDRSKVAIPKEVKYAIQLEHLSSLQFQSMPRQTR
jgi:hypothetical protein